MWPSVCAWNSNQNYNIDGMYSSRMKYYVERLQLNYISHIVKCFDMRIVCVCSVCVCAYVTSCCALQWPILPDQLFTLSHPIPSQLLFGGPQYNPQLVNTPTMKSMLHPRGTLFGPLEHHRSFMGTNSSHGIQYPMFWMPQNP